MNCCNCNCAFPDFEMSMLKSPAMISFESVCELVVMVSMRLNRSFIGVFGARYKFFIRKGIWLCKMSIVIDLRCLVANVCIFCTVVFWLEQVSSPCIVNVGYKWKLFLSN